MSRGDLQEMEQSKTAVNANAKAGDPMQHLTTGGTSTSYEDLGGPTPQDYNPDNDSAKLKEPKVATVKDVVNKSKNLSDVKARQGNTGEVFIGGMKVKSISGADSTKLKIKTRKFN